MEQKVKNIIIERLSIHESDYNPNANFKEEWECDSLDLVEIIVDCEKEFKINIPDYVVSDMHTPQNLIDYIKRIQE